MFGKLGKGSKETYR